MTQLGEITEPKIDQAGPPPTGYFTYVDISSVDNGTKRILDPKVLHADSAPSRARQRLRSGDVLVSMTRPNLNAVALVPPELDGAIGSTGFHVLRARENVLPQWLYYGVQTRQFVGSMSELVQGALYPAVRPKDIRAFNLCVPELTEQRRIVAELEKQFSRLEEAVNNLERAKANLERYLVATLGEAFSGKWAGIEANWRTVPLRVVADVQLGQQRAPLHAAAANAIPYVRAANVTWRGLDLSDVKSMGFPNPERYRLAYGDILLAEASGSANEVGKPAVWREEIPGACYQKTLIRVRCRTELLNYEFAYYFFLHTALSGQFAKLAPGVGILHLTAERMLVWPTVAPPLGVQALIVAEIDRRLSIVREIEAEVEASLRRAHALRQTILSKQFSGTTVVQQGSRECRST